MRASLALMGTLAAVLAASAKTLTVRDQDVLWVDNADTNGTWTVTTVTEDYSALPTDFGTPTFWMDASSTSGWTLGSGGKVSVIPSKSGSRQLLSDTSGASWTGWGSTANLPPYLVKDAELGVNVVDFGAVGSQRAMIFDKVGSVNRLSTIGTVVMVVNASAGGGWVLGGGLSALNEWKRAGSWWDLTDATPYNPLAASDAADAFLHGHTRHNGAEFVASRVGWTGGWEVFSFTATSAARAAQLAATGLGINDGTASGAASSGGLKIAELVIYDTILSAAQVAALEKSLRYKWLGTSAYGDNGNARLGELDILNKQSTRNGMTTVLAPTAGDTLEVDRVRGGRNVGRFGSSPYLTDAQMLEENDHLRLNGSVKLGDLSHFAGNAYFDGGTVRFEPRAIPTVDELPAGLVARFDASEAASLTTVTESKTKYVTKMANLATGSFACTGLSLQPSPDEGGWDRRPWLQTGWTGTDRPLVDFGTWCYTPSSSTHEGRSFGFFKDNTHAGQVPLTTVIAFVDTRRGGGCLMNSGFRRAKESLSHFTYAIMASGDEAVTLSTDPFVSSTNGCAYLDGAKVADPFNTGVGFGQKVIAIQVPGATPDRIGGLSQYMLGALVFGEMLLWDRPLTDLEIRDASAYLAKRWMNKSLPGYERTEETKEIDFENVTITNAACEIVIAPGTDVRFRKLTVSVPLTISGGGLLKVDSLSAGKISVATQDGSRIVYGDLSDVTQKCQIASKPGFHFDPTDTRTWTLKTISGEQRVMDVFDDPHDQRLYAANTSGYIQEPKDSIAPRYTTSTFPVGTMPVIDCTSSSTGKAAYGLTFEKPLAVCSAYVVWRPGSVGTFLLGCTGYEMAVALGYTTTYGYDWHRDNYVATPPSTNKYYGCLFNTNAGQGMQHGTAYTNGVKCASAYYNYMKDNEWYLVEVHPLTPHHVSSLGLERGGAQNVAYGEVILFERELSEREKTATRNYLMKKWFGKKESELEDLPDETTTRAPELAVDEEITLDDPHDMLVDKLTGEGDLYKTGVKDLEVIDAGEYSGTVHVEAGTLTLSGRPTDPGALTTRVTPALHLDASQTDTITVRQRGDRCEATRWTSTVGDGFSAKAAAGLYGEGRQYPFTFTSAAKYAPDSDLHLKNVIQMQKALTADTTECYQFMDENDNWTAVTNIQTVLWVLGSQEGGGFLLGGGDTVMYDEKDGGNKYYAWHRGNPGNGAYASDPLTSTSGMQEATGWGAIWRVNGTKVPYNQEDVLSGTWDVISCQSKSAPASGLAFDGRCLVGKSYSSRCGRQRLAELIIYKETLTDEEIADAENYLAVKWGVNNAVGYTTNEMKVDLAAGTTLECGGIERYLDGLSGAGTVNGDVVVKRFTVTDPQVWLTVSGTLTVAENPIVDLADIAQSGNEIVVAEASEILGRENLANAQFVGSVGSRSPHLRVSENRLVVKFDHGLIFVIP